jgi:hypothetical protein
VINLNADQVEEVVRWYILAGPVLSMTPERMATMGGGGGGGGLGLGHHATVGLILGRCPYKVDGFAPIYLAVRAELRYEAASREFMTIGQLEQGTSCSFVRDGHGAIITDLEACRRRMDRWDREIEWMRTCPQFDPCVAWLGAQFALVGHEDQSFLPLVMGA